MRDQPASSPLLARTCLWLADRWAAPWPGARDALSLPGGALCQLFLLPGNRPCDSLRDPLRANRELVRENRSDSFPARDKCLAASLTESRYRSAAPCGTENTEAHRKPWSSPRREARVPGSSPGMTGRP
jgi:hypothetical protein